MATEALTDSQQIRAQIAILERIENKIDAFKEIPAEVRELREQVRKLRAEESAAQERWRDIVYRVLTSFAGLVKPEKKHDRPPTGDEADGRTPPPIS